MERDFQAIVIRELSALFEPVIKSTQSVEDLERLLARLGWDPTLIPTDVVADVVAKFQETSVLVENIKSPPNNLVELLTFIDNVKEIIEAFRSFPDSFSHFLADLNPPPDIGDISDDLLSLLVVEYLENRAPVLNSVLWILDVIRKDESAVEILADNRSFVVRTAVRPVRVDLRRVVDLLRDPVDALASSYLPQGQIKTDEEARVFSDRLFPKLVLLFANLGMRLFYGARESDRNAFPTEAAFQEARRTLRIATPTIPVSEETAINAVIDVTVVPDTGNGAGVRVVPTGVVDYDNTIGPWKVEFSVGGTAPSITITSQELSFEGVGAAYLEGRLHAMSEAGREPIIRIGPANASHLSIGLFTLRGFIGSAERNFGLEIVAADSAFKLGGDDGDGFLNKLLPEDGLECRFELGMGWSKRDGFKLSGSLGIVVDLPIGMTIANTVTIKSVYLGLIADQDSLACNVGISMSMALGPLSATVERVGLRSLYLFGGSASGASQFGFLPPTGAGLAIAAGPIVGGGFLDFNKDEQRYAGILQLGFGEIGMVAIGLITTRMPDGSNGFSMLVNIGITFSPPIQLSFGFTLSAVGGLIGINRTMEIDVLRVGIKNRTLDSILFPDPETVIANAQKIISDLRSVFPPSDGRFIVGPMIKLGWGAPTIITADVGIFLELPDPVRIVFMGQLEMALPEKKAPIVIIHLDILGVLDFEKGELSFQATLYDSRVMALPIDGDAAFLVAWKNDPRFALSLGGFHPLYLVPPPPTVFADMKRLTIGISKDSNLQLSCSAYFALTPNALMFGARADLYAAASGAVMRGYLSFDALVHFSPFSFEIQIGAGVDVSYEGVDLTSVDLYFVLSGPTPWVARGSAEFEVLYVSVSVDFTFTWGDANKATLPAVDPWEKLPETPGLLDALELPESWGTVLPEGRSLVESLRAEADAQGTQLVVHSAGRLEVRQNVVPLNMVLAMVANAPIKDHDHFTIDMLEVNGEALEGLQPSQEFFARGQFEELGIRKLSVPSFEKMAAGVTTAALEAVKMYGAHDEVELGYDSILIQPDGTSKLTEIKGYPDWADAKVLLGARAKRAARQRAGSNARFSTVRGRAKVGLREEGYAVVNSEDLSRADIATGGGQANRGMTRAMADRVLSEQIARDPGRRGEYRVVPEYEVAA